MAVSDGLVPVWHQGIGSDHDGKYRPVTGYHMSYLLLQIQVFWEGFLSLRLNVVVVK